MQEITGKRWSIFFIVGILNGLFFIGTFRLLQDDVIFQHSIGSVSHFLTLMGRGEKETLTAYTSLSSQKLENWDSKIYRCLAERMYDPTQECFGNVRAAFFPLFPLVWKQTRLSAIGVSVMNYCLFFLGLAWLTLFFYRVSISEQIILFGLMLTLPSAIIFYIPYSEALFLALATVAVTGMIQKKYWVYFIAILLLSMVRVASVFVLLAIVGVELWGRVPSRPIKETLIVLFYKSIPFVIGYILVFTMQYYYTGSWSAFMEAHQLWDAGVKGFDRIGDWSHESFGLSSYTLFYICLPVTLFVLYLLFRSRSDRITRWKDSVRSEDERYLVLISCLYIFGILLFTLLTSGGNIHSFYRFVLASPFFYISLAILMRKVSGLSRKVSLTYYLLMFSLVAIFLWFNQSRSTLCQIAYGGLFLYLLTSLYLLFKSTITKRIQLIFFAFLFIMNTVWNTYLFNRFLEGGWIFT